MTPDLQDAMPPAAQAPAAQQPTAQPKLHQRALELQPYGMLVRMPVALAEKVRRESVGILNQALADTMVLRDLYKKHHWQTAGATFYQLHLLYDKHYEEQVEIVDLLAERIQTLGGIALAPDVAEATMLPRAPRGREEVPVQISRLLECHEMLLLRLRRDADRTAGIGDQGTNDLLVSDVIRVHEKQVWFLAEHLVPAPLTEA